MLSKVRTPTGATCKGVVTSRKNGPSPYTFTHVSKCLASKNVPCSGTILGSWFWYHSWYRYPSYNENYT